MKYLETNLTRILKVVNLLVDMHDDIAYEIIKRFFICATVSLRS